MAGKTTIVRRDEARDAIAQAKKGEGGTLVPISAVPAPRLQLDYVALNATPGATTPASSASTTSWARSGQAWVWASG